MTGQELFALYAEQCRLKYGLLFVCWEKQPQKRKDIWNAMADHVADHVSKCISDIFK